ncbi:general odorant-binding protein 19d-like [Teleopsis dalmanni]|uniref:general odorant-binding protein 19d-like n=1 Tax=Teleopsis dalmanni TaxID=139649 RepID=UPI0018CF1709|nr:general odorant-binding protein 19d-like [Teleopsis dalmanni]XP_037935907.1 general odorant-binding protein 19d-like [Teleopsis dalmanni]
MKILSVLLLCIAAVFVESQEFSKEKLTALGNECKTETGATEDDMKLLFNHGPAETTAAKCLKDCVMKKLNLLTDDGKLNKETAIAIKNIIANGDAAQEKAGDEVIEICYKLEPQKDKCETAEALDQCFRNNSEAKGFTFVN